MTFLHYTFIIPPQGIDWLRPNIGMYHLEVEKNWINFGDFITGGQSMFKNALSALCLLNGSADFNKTCTDILLGDAKELIRFWWPWRHFQGHLRSKKLENAFSHFISWRDGWVLTKSAQIYFWEMKKNWSDSGDLDPTSRSQKVRKCWRMPCLYSISWRDGF